MARPTKFNQKRADRIVEAIRAGNWKRTAARSAGVSERTLNRWLAKGRAEESGPFSRFVLHVDQADALAEIDAVAKWQTHFETSPRAVAEFLKRRFPERWNVPRL